MVFAHVSVMVREVLELLNPQAHKTYLDGTVGGGGHAEQILSSSGPDGRVLALDRDEEAIMASQTRLARFGDRCVIRQANFKEAKVILQEIGWKGFDGILLDLGISSYHVESPERGFSFQTVARLDMRMDRRQSLDAYQIVNTFSGSALEQILRDYGEEPLARRIASAIVIGRKERPIETTQQLAQLVAGVTGAKRRGHQHHPATRTFQALRIAVNEELQSLEAFLEDAYELLFSGGRMVVISFHSLEDRLVKMAFRKWSRDCLCPAKAPDCRCGWSRKARLLTSKPLVPADAEIEANPRARSAKLRAAERI